MWNLVFMNILGQRYKSGNAYETTRLEEITQETSMNFF